MKSAKLYVAIVAVGTSIASATGTRVVREPDRLQPRDGQQIPSAIPVPNKQTSHGCYSSGGNMTKVGVEHMSSGSCVGACIDKKYWVAGLNGDQCLCGYAYPPTKSHTDDAKCSYPCPYFPQEACGGLSNGNGGTGYYSIFNTGLNIDVNNYEPPKSSSSKSSTTSTTTSTTSSQTASTTQSSTEAASTTAVSSVTSTADSDKDDKSSGPNVAAIAAGVVAGVVVVAAAIAGGFFYLRRKRNAEIEEEHRRNAAVNAFISGSQPPSTSGSISMTDSRLDPVMAHRRLSDGSIADNQDYSRKILRVTNA